LWEISDFADSLNISLGWLAITGTNLCQRSLSSTVSSNQPYFVPGRNSKVHLTHQGSSTYGDLKILDTEQVVDPLLGVLAKALVYNRDRTDLRRR
jgi:hypothetical protein